VQLVLEEEGWDVHTYAHSAINCIGDGQ